jgi:hypothetical protein
MMDPVFDVSLKEGQAAVYGAVFAEKRDGVLGVPAAFDEIVEANGGDVVMRSRVREIAPFIAQGFLIVARGPRKELAEAFMKHGALIANRGEFEDTWFNEDMPVVMPAINEPVYAS